eukprot:2807892-Pleurochrysis_carterae.AAC.6
MSVHGAYLLRCAGGAGVRSTAVAARCARRTCALAPRRMGGSDGSARRLRTAAAAAAVRACAFGCTDAVGRADSSGWATARLVQTHRASVAAMAALVLHAGALAHAAAARAALLGVRDPGAVVATAGACVRSGGAESEVRRAGRGALPRVAAAVSTLQLALCTHGCFGGTARPAAWCSTRDGASGARLLRGREAFARQRERTGARRANDAAEAPCSRTLHVVPNDRLGNLASGTPPQR